MKFKDKLLHFLPLAFNGMIIVFIAILIFARESWTHLLPFTLILVPLYIAECVVDFVCFKRRK